MTDSSNFSAAAFPVPSIVPDESIVDRMVEMVFRVRRLGLRPEAFWLSGEARERFTADLAREAVIYDSKTAEGVPEGAFGVFMSVPMRQSTSPFGWSLRVVKAPADG